jgi:hypothetical protein
MTIDTDAIFAAVNDQICAHMEAQPYQINYSDGSKVDFESEVDSDGDLILTIVLPDQISELENELEEARERIADLEEEIRGLKVQAS